MRKNERGPSYLLVALGGLQNCYRAHPPLFFALMAVSALLCAIEVGELYAMKILFDAVAAHATGRIALSGVVVASVPMAALLTASPLVRTLEYLGQGYFWRRGSGYLMARTHARVASIPLISLEKSETFDRMTRARLGSEAAPSASRSILQFVFHFLPYLALTCVVLARIQPMLVLALLIIFASVTFSQALRAGIVRRFAETSANPRRRAEALENAVTGRECARETRTLGAADFFFRLYLDAVRQYNRASLRAQRKIALVELLLRVVHILGYAGILALLIYYLVRGDVSAGAFAAVFYSVERMSGVLKTMVDQFGEALSEMSAAAFTHDFLQSPAQAGSEKQLDKRQAIRLDGASFTYPGRDTPAVREVTLTIRPGETLAIVGENGAGKSTLASLILGLYQPTRGCVRCGDATLAAYAPSARFERVSGVFQKFARYKMTLGENIAISQTGAPDDVLPAAGAAGVHASSLASGMETMLSREFGGAELSGGQWQRVAIARGLYRAHDVIVLDEPTAAIDPIEESKLFRLFRDTSANKTAILVTHRLGSARIADRIILMEAGAIQETGTHAELMALGGKYASLYRAQADWYDR